MARNPDTAALASTFHRFGRVEAPEVDSPMYAELAYGVSNDDQLLELAGHTRSGQPPPNMLFASVQYLLLVGDDHSLRRHYPALTGAERPLEPAFPEFRDFCLTRRPAIIELLASRRTQTNVITRCGCLLPAFAHLSRGRIGDAVMIEIGPSAGLNMIWDRYRYRYLDPAGEPAGEWGDEDSPVVLETMLKGRDRPPIAPSFTIVQRLGIDVNPIDLTDADQIRWLRALIWPEHVARHAQLEAAATLASTDPPRMIPGDASEMLSQVLDDAPSGAAVIVYATHVFYQMDTAQRHRLYDVLEAFAGSGRRVDLITMDASDRHYSLIRHRAFTGGKTTTTLLAHANPHGHWLEWMAV